MSSHRILASCCNLLNCEETSPIKPSSLNVSILIHIFLMWMRIELIHRLIAVHTFWRVYIYIYFFDVPKLMLGKTRKRRRGQQMMRWLDSITASMNVDLSKLQEIVHN